MLGTGQASTQDDAKILNVKRCAFGQRVRRMWTLLYTLTHEPYMISE